MRKGDASIMYVGNTILDAAAEAGIDENWSLLDNHSTRNTFINVKYLSNIEMLLMDNIYASIVMQE